MKKIIYVDSAEWLVNYHKNGGEVDEETLQAARNILEENPVIGFNCIECDIEWAARTNSEQEMKRLCYRCHLHTLRSKVD